jgi:hypothetical protein
MSKPRVPHSHNVLLAREPAQVQTRSASRLSQAAHFLFFTSDNGPWLVFEAVEGTLHHPIRLRRGRPRGPARAWRYRSHEPDAAARGRGLLWADGERPLRVGARGVAGEARLVPAGTRYRTAPVAVKGLILSTALTLAPLFLAVLVTVARVLPGLIV